MIDFWSRLIGELEEGRKALAVFVAHSSKGSPGTPKAQLLLREDGSTYGTVGGGIMERDLIERGRQILLDNDLPLPSLETLDHSRSSPQPSGLICGGRQSNVFVLFHPSDTPLLQSIRQASKAAEPKALSITPKGCQIESADTSPHFPRRFVQTGSEEWSLQLNLRNHRRVAIIGAGHCGQALVRQMLWLGFEVRLFDQRSTIELSESTDNAHRVIGQPIQAFLDQYQDWPECSVVVMTHSYPTDLSALLEILPLQPLFLGLMGSPRKLQQIFAELRREGVSETSLRSITAPVGLSIGSDTPEEIAVSVSAQLLQFHNTLSAHASSHADHLYSK